MRTELEIADAGYRADVAETLAALGFAGVSAGAVFACLVLNHVEFAYRELEKYTCFLAKNYLSCIADDGYPVFAQKSAELFLVERKFDIAMGIEEQDFILCHDERAKAEACDGFECEALLPREPSEIPLYESGFALFGLFGFEPRAFFAICENAQDQSGGDGEYQADKKDIPDFNEEIQGEAEREANKAGNASDDTD